MPTIELYANSTILIVKNMRWFGGLSRLFQILSLSQDHVRRISFSASTFGLIEIVGLAVATPAAIEGVSGVSGGYGLVSGVFFLSSGRRRVSDRR